MKLERQHELQGAVLKRKVRISFENPSGITVGLKLWLQLETSPIESVSIEWSNAFRIVVYNWLLIFFFLTDWGSNGCETTTGWGFEEAQRDQKAEEGPHGNRTTTAGVSNSSLQRILQKQTRTYYCYGNWKVDLTFRRKREGDFYIPWELQGLQLQMPHKEDV